MNVHYVYLKLSSCIELGCVEPIVNICTLCDSEMRPNIYGKNNNHMHCITCLNVKTRSKRCTWFKHLVNLALGVATSYSDHPSNKSLTER